MEKLSFRSYVWKCILGAETVYLLCLFGGMLAIRSASATQLHHRLFETLPGFTWLTTSSVILGAVYVFVIAMIFGLYYVWMHNSSLVRGDNQV